MTFTAVCFRQRSGRCLRRDTGASGFSRPGLVKTKPELAKVAPFSTVLEILKGDRAAIAKLTMPDLERLAATTLTGMPVETFEAQAKKWLAEAKDPRWYTKAGDGTRLAMIVVHDDAKREYAYGPAKGLPATKVGASTQAFYDEAMKNGFIVISMKDDWKKIFAFE